MNEKLNIRLAEECDKARVLNLLNGVFGEQQRSNLERDEAFWSWKYKNNPFGNSLLTIVESEGVLVGVGNLWPWEFTCRGETIKALQPCDSAVHPDYRGRGLFTKTRIEGIKIARQREFDLFFNFPNQNSLPTYLALGWDYLGCINWHVKILRPFNIIKGKIKESKSEVLLIPNCYEVDVEVLDKISSKSQSFDSKLRIKRVDGFHQWRYLDHPTRKYGMITIKNGAKSIIAAVFTLNQKGVNKEMVIVDILGNPTRTTDLFKEVILAAKELEIDFIAVVQNEWFSTNELWKLGFVKKKLKNMVVLPLNISLEGKISKFNSWNMVAAIHDSI